MEIDAVNSVPIAGQPVAYGIGFLALVLHVFFQIGGRYALTLAHEGGHMLALVLSFRPVTRYELDDHGGGVTKTPGLRWAPSNLLVAFAGYATPSLLGWGGAALIASGNTWSVLILTLVLCLFAVAVPGNPLAFVVPALIVFGIAWALIGATPQVQATVAVGIVWYLLIGGAIRNLTIFTDKGDAAALKKSTLVIPGFVWKVLWNVLSLYCLFRGGSLLLRGA